MTPSERTWTRVAIASIGIVIALWAASVVAVLEWGRRDTARPADAIVVLGAAQYVGHPSPVLRARLDHAVALWHGGLAPWMVVTGGAGRGDTTSEAAVGRRYLVRHGVPDSAILMENVGRTTRESLEHVVWLLRGRGLTSVILVSDAFHMLRLSILARELGLVAYTSPTPSSPIAASRSQRIAYVAAESVKAPLTLLLTLF